MSATVLLLILLAAVVHAVWNVLIKSSGDPLLTSARAIGAATVVAFPLGCIIWLVAERPGLPAEALLLAIVSSVVELAYFLFLSEAYRRGEISVVYPLARGTAPLLAVIAGVVLLGERLNVGEAVGVGLLLVGIWVARRPARGGPAVVPAVLTGVCIATYSAIDRVGVRLTSPWLYGWILWTCIAVFLVGWTAMRRGGLVSLWPEVARAASGPVDDPDGAGRMQTMPWPRALLVGTLIMSPYFVVLWALSEAPLTIVSPLRESAIVLVTVWSIWRLRERRDAAIRLAAAAVILAGIWLVAVS